MKRLRLISAIALSLLTCVAMAQSWATAYAAGLKAAHAQKWSDARQAFLQAAAIRPEDASAATTLPGPITERRQWRDGAPYSPNFLAAYAAFRSANAAKQSEAQVAMLHTVSEELQVLIDKGEVSAPTLYYLNAAYTRLGDSEKAQALVAKTTQPDFKMDWRVDTEVVDPQELAQINALVTQVQQTQSQAQAQASAGKPGQTKISRPKQSAPGTVQAGQQPLSGPEGGAGAAIISSSIIGPVPQNPNKFALLIGNSDTRIQDQAVPFASDDAQRMRETLINSAGYLDSNVDLILNGTADQIMASAKAMADRVSQDSTVFIYFSGVGTNIDGKDFLAGVEAEALDSSSGLVAKSDLYRLFMLKGAHIFAFFQADRPIVAGRFFGMEVPLVGSIAQSEATLPGDKVSAWVRNGKQIGVYTDALAGVLTDLRSNKVPINEFGWQVFYRIRRGDTGTTGGGSRQTPTLPVLTNMAADARF